MEDKLKTVLFIETMTFDNYYEMVIKSKNGKIKKDIKDMYIEYIKQLEEE